MQIQSEDDFPELRRQISLWYKRFPMFKHNVREVEQIIENHIKNYSKALVSYRQTRSKSHLEIAQNEIDSINRVLSTVGKMELMAILSQS